MHVLTSVGTLVSSDVHVALICACLQVVGACQHVCRNCLMVLTLDVVAIGVRT